MSELPRGLYETLLTESLASQLRELAGGLSSDLNEIRTAEIADRIALHLARLIRRTVDAVPEKDRVESGIGLAKKLVEQLGGDALFDTPVSPGRILRAVLSLLPDGKTETIEEPLLPLLDTTLLTNSPGEPRVGSQILGEIHSADQIDVVMAFIRRTGIRPLLDALRQHVMAGRSLRILTTTFTGTTEQRALDELKAIGAQIRVSYESDSTRLHAKAWLFHRKSGFSTAYVGSSNLTHAAMVTGLEWNVRVSGARNPDVLEKITAVFESYWKSGDFVDYDQVEFATRSPLERKGNDLGFLSPIELRPEPFQDRLLEQIAASREMGHHRNLLVSATGTGKTVMAAIDYARLRSQIPKGRLLFVAHRQEILEQSRATFRHALRDPAFGEMWVGGQRPNRFEHVFASIQSLNAADLGNIDPRHFDIVTVDEFHHAAASSYKKLINHLKPVELLGLTATPERSDGLPILEWFGNRIAAELRLWDAIDQRYLCPFLYYGIHDGVDLREVPWHRGRGYDVEGLTRILTADDARARTILSLLLDHVGNPNRMRALGFCVSVDHARFMARVFNEAGVASRAIWGDTDDSERRDALSALSNGDIRVLFSVDLFNEGIDVPSVDTVLFLRPTDSPVLFLQQLGRGLRLHRGKSACTVLDFVGHHRSEFRFDRRFRALLGGTRADLQRQIQAGFPFLPAGCEMQLDPVASKIILENLRQGIPAYWRAKVGELQRLVAAGKPVTLGSFLQESGLELEELYNGSKSWSDLREAAGLPVKGAGPHEADLRRACGRLVHIDDLERIREFTTFLSADSPPNCRALPDRQQRLVRMLASSLTQQVLEEDTTLEMALELIWQHPQIREEMLELLQVLSERIDHLHKPIDRHPRVPLQIHGRYSRIEILAAFGVGKTARTPLWQSGVWWAEAEKADLFAFTLDKTSGSFSPTTRYRDYAISRGEIHWESQSDTRAGGEIGIRYQNHIAQGTSIMLFARLRADDRSFWFLGPATYVSHKSEQPMQVIWRLEYPLPGDLFEMFAAAVA